MSSPDARVIERATAALKNGRLVAFPTDTLYALGARARDASAVARVFAVKGRGDDKALPLFVDGTAMAEEVGVFTEPARQLARRFWPGALTLVVEKRPDFESAALVGGGTVALRAPANDTALSLIRGLGEPITATSANRSGGKDPVTAEDVRGELGEDVDLIIDGGACPQAAPSTIVDCTSVEVRILRAGAVPEEAVREALAAGSRRER
jgi:L-threonylcarbamoyladenylate synthase